ncbi:MAG: sulfatase-like hydrolase/transferase [Candidatus Omnitrophica bacterium]|nr:sulfatase-like hydrolase/transferase [Candidatus Omnitrophota bacterium]
MNKQHNRREALKTLGLTAAFPCIALRSHASSATKPNIVFIIADDMGWSDIGYNNPKIQTPNLDRLARQGVTLTHHYAAPTCTPTRVGIMTGHYPSRYGVHGPDYGRIFRDDTVTLPAILQNHGYFTAISGKWHMGSPPDFTPLKYGFQSSYGYFHGQVDPYAHDYKTGEKTWHRNDEYLEEEGHVTDLITREAVRIIESKKKEPFFLYVAYSIPHFPLNEPEKWSALYANEKEASRQWFQASVTHMDHGIGRIVQALDRQGVREDTLIVFVSDNGGQKSWSSDTQYHGRYADKPHAVLGDNTPLRGWKGDVYEGGVRVPAFVNWQGTLSPNTVDDPVHFTDWAPTLCRASGCSPSRDLDWDGVDAWPIVSGKTKNSASRSMYWNTGSMTAVRQDDWKLIQSADGKTVELYNINDDPLEQRDAAAQNPQKVNALQQLLKEIQKKDGPKLKP